MENPGQDPRSKACVRPQDETLYLVMYAGSSIQFFFFFFFFFFCGTGV
jgi:hypothetical protein